MVDNPFSSSTETSVFAQRTPLIDGKILNLIAVTYSAEVAIANVDDIEMLTTQAIPKSFAANIRRLRTAVQNNPQRAPYGLPKFNMPRETLPDRKETGYPLFWIRRENIDLDSVWWNVFRELNQGQNNSPTDFNEEYWTRDPDDPDINRLPGDNFTKLTERPVLVDAIKDGGLSPENAVPYELVHPEWFKLHPDFEPIADEIGRFGINVRNDLLKPLRESESGKDVDHMMLGFFVGLVPSSDEDIKYIYKFFKNLFRDRAFKTALPKQISPCVTNVVTKDGLYKHNGNKFGWINEEGNTLSQLKNNNYYYEYSANDDPEIDMGQLFVFDDAEELASLELQAKQVLIRKVKGKIKSGKIYEMVLGKGAPFPEFTNEGDVLYPVNPTVTPTEDPAALVAYDNNVLRPHAIEFSELDGLSDKDPTTYISIKFQRGKSIPKGDHEWDKETFTGLVGDVDYYEEIIIILPRIEYRGVYSKAFKTSKVFNTFMNGDYWKSGDRHKIYDYKSSSNSYVLITIPGGYPFRGVDGETDSLAIPLIDSALRTMILREREEVVARAFSTIGIAVVRVKVSFLKKNLGLIIQIAFIVVGIITQNPELISEGITFEALLSTIAQAFIESIIFGAISDAIINILVDQFGIEAAGAIATLLVAAATIYGVRTNGDFFNDDMFKLISNFDDSWVQLSQESLEDDLKKIEEVRRENIQKLAELKEQTEYLLGDVDPNIALQTRVFLIDNETPEQFYSRTLENKNPGVGVYDALATQIDRFKWISHTELPKIAVDEESDAEYINKLV